MEETPGLGPLRKSSNGKLLPRGRGKPWTYRMLVERCVLNRETQCWEWGGGTMQGYGYCARGAGLPTARTHRLMWELRYGGIPEGMFVCHRCDNPLCCNPQHLFLGTQKDNMGDAARKGRYHKPWKLTNGDAERIRELYAEGGRTFDSIAEEYGVSANTIARAVRIDNRYPNRRE